MVMARKPRHMNYDTIQRQPMMIKNWSNRQVLCTVACWFGLLMFVCMSSMNSSSTKINAEGLGSGVVRSPSTTSSRLGRLASSSAFLPRDSAFTRTLPKRSSFTSLSGSLTNHLQLRTVTRRERGSSAITATLVENDVAQEIDEFDMDDEELLRPEDRAIADQVMAGDITILKDVDGPDDDVELNLLADDSSSTQEEDGDFYWEDITASLGNNDNAAAVPVGVEAVEGAAIEAHPSLDQALEMMEYDVDEADEFTFTGDPFDLNFDDEVIGVDDSEDFAKALATAMSDVKAENISIVYVRKIRSYTSYVVIGSVFSRPQTDAVKKKVAEKAQTPEWNRERVCEREDEAKSAGWHCLDYGDVIVHVMTPDQRQYYDLDGLYSKGESVDLPGVTGIMNDLAL